MRTIYKPTALESWVGDQLWRIGIREASHLDEERICRYLGIYYKKLDKDSHSVEIGRFKLICVNSLVNEKEQRKQFFHELGHILRHAGRQIMMPNTFREWQEWDANNFTLYAALPYYMIREYDLSSYDIIEQLSNTFRVSEELVTKRLDQIKRNSIKLYSYT